MPQRRFDFSFEGSQYWQSICLGENDDEDIYCYEDLKEKVRKIYKLPISFEFFFAYKNQYNDQMVVCNQSQFVSSLPVNYSIDYQHTGHRPILTYFIVPLDQVMPCIDKYTTNITEEPHATESVTESVAESVQSVVSGFETSLCSFQTNIENNMKTINSSVEERIKNISLSLEKKITELAENMERNVQLVEKNASKSTNENVEMIIKSATQLYNSIASRNRSNEVKLNDSLQFDVLCNSCYSPIRGQRWRCETCEDFDLCSTCKCHLTHHPDHTFRFIKDTMNNQIVYTCDYCNLDIVGIRHTCTSCPDFDLCYSCFGSVQENHPPKHTFIAQLVSNDAKLKKKSFDAKKKLPQAIHSNIYCDICDTDIKGIRYKCGHCPDFDLCEKCEKKTYKTHTKGHIFLKIREPIQSCSGQPLLPKLTLLEETKELNAVNFKELPIIDSSLPTTSIKSTDTLQNQLEKEYVARVERIRIIERKARDAAKQSLPMDYKNESKGSQTQMNKKNVVTSSLPVHIQRDDAKISSMFLADLNIPDGTVVAPKKNFIKMWKVKNDGDRPWPSGSRLLFNGGSIFKPYPMSYPQSFDIPSAAPGEETCIIAELQSPDAPGSYNSIFCFMTPEGTRFGDELWCSIVVSQEEQESIKEHEMIFPTLSTQHVGSIATSTDSCTIDSRSSSPGIHFTSDDFLEDDRSSKHHAEEEDNCEAESVSSHEFFLIDNSQENIHESSKPPSKENICELSRQNIRKLSQQDILKPSTKTSQKPDHVKQIGNSSESTNDNSSDEFSEFSEEFNSVSNEDSSEDFTEVVKDESSDDMNGSYASTATVKVGKDVTISDDFSYKSQLTQLREMGFSCDEESVKLLSENNGKIDKVISQLLEKDY